MFSNLNKEQYEAVHLPLDVNALILAGAGSGKTRVLTTRVFYLLSQNVEESSILAVTFTNKAAKEMVNRLGRAGNAISRRMWVGTFHGIAARLLRLHALDAGLSPQFQIMDADDQKNLIKRILKEHFAHLEEREEDNKETFSPSNVAAWINRQKEKAIRANRVDVSEDLPQDQKERRQLLVEIYKMYEKVCAASALVDFAELILRTVELLKHNERVRKHYQKRFTHILIDEFQDINNLQFQWMELIAQGGAKLFVVGDDDQSIYAFRGANVEILRQFSKKYAAQTVQLGQNYRSVSNILTAANRLIENNPDRFMEKRLWTNKQGGELVRCHRAYSAESEAEFVVEEIEKLHQNGVPLSHFAILYRINALSRNFEVMMIRHKLKYFIYGGQGFFAREEIKHVLAYLRLIANPDDDNAFLRVVNVPKRGIGVKLLENLSLLARAEGTSLFETASRLNAQLLQKFLPFLNLIQNLRQQEEGKASLFELTQFLFQQVDFKSYYEAKEKNKEKSDSRLANLNEFLNAVQNFMDDEDQDKSQGELNAFLAYAALYASEHQNAKEDAVQMMSVHLSKGLEFPYVFVVGVEEGILPHTRALFSKNKTELYEERRLFYVAMTRAEKKLYLTYVKKRPLFGNDNLPPPSSFLKDLRLEDVSVFLKTKEADPFYVVPKKAEDSFIHTLRVDTAQNKLGETLDLGGKVTHPKFGSGQILGFVEGKGLGTVKIYFEQCGFKELDLNLSEVRPVKD